MVPPRPRRSPLRTSVASRRTFLQTSGVLIATGLAGCELRHRSEDGTDDGPGGDPGGDSGDDPGRNPGDSPGGETKTTVPPDATYDLQVENRITADNLNSVEGLPADTPARLTVEVEKNYRNRDDEILFERTLELAPEETRSFEDVFSTTADGPEHVIAAKLDPYRDEEDTGSTSTMSLTSAERFEPAGFGAPTSTTFYVLAMDGKEGPEFSPWIQVRNERPESR